MRRLVVVPDGPLHRLPFDVLVMPDGRYAVERFAISVTPAASLLVRLWEQRAGAPPTNVAVLADPRFADEIDAVAGDAEVFRSARGGTGGLPRLRGSLREARVISRFTDVATIRRRSDGSRRRFPSSSRP